MINLVNLRKISIPDSIEEILGKFSSEYLEYSTYQGLKYLGNSESPYLILCCAIDDSVTTVVTHPNTKVVLQGAFNGNANIESVTLNDGLITIGMSAFGGTSIKTIVIPNSVKKVSIAFVSCTMLESVVIGSEVTFIESSTFLSCTSLTTVTILGKVKEIENAAFDGCSSITDVYFAGTAEEWDNIEIGFFNGYFTSATIHYI